MVTHANQVLHDFWCVANAIVNNRDIQRKEKRNAPNAVRKIGVDEA